MTRRTLGHVLLSLASSFMHELDRDPRRLIISYVRGNKLVTTITVRGDWLLRLPVTIEARRVICWSRFEDNSAWLVADRAVVVILHWGMRKCACRLWTTQERNHVLVFVVRKLDRELQLRRRITKRQSRLITRRSFGVTDGTDRRSRAFEKLRAVTTHTRVMSRVIDDVRIR
jgi:hypothetical protein